MDTDEKLADLVKTLNKAKIISFDTETTSTEEMRADIVGISLAVKEGEGYYIPIGHTRRDKSPAERGAVCLEGADDQSQDRQDRSQRQI